MSQFSRRMFMAGTAGLLASSACSTAAVKKRAVVPVRFERERFVEDVKRASREPGAQQAIEELIAAAVADSSAVMRELGEPTKFAVEMLHRDERITILHAVWPPLAVMVPHNHLMWATIGVYCGREDNMMWRRDGHVVEATRGRSVGKKEIFSLPSNAIHSVTNPTEQYTGAIHVYGGDLAGAPRSQWDPVDLQEGPFDLEDGRRILLQADERAKQG